MITMMTMMITVKQLSLLGMGRDSNQTMSSHPSIINIESLHLTFFMSMMMMMTAGEITGITMRSEEHTSELQSHSDLVCRLLLEKKKNRQPTTPPHESRTA